MRQTLEEIIDGIEQLLDEFAEQIEPLDRGIPVTITRYRSPEALERNHPRLPGGLPVHNTVVAAMLREARAEGFDAVAVWDDDPTALIGQDW